jgi:hypothetical protein
MPKAAVGTFTLEPDTVRPYDFYIDEGRKWPRPDQRHAVCLSSD